MSHTKKYLSINLTKYVHNFYDENYKLIQGIKKDLNTWIYILYL